MSNPVKIRLATTDDAEAVSAIYNREVLESTVTMDMVARSVEDQAAWIEARSGGLVALVAEIEGEVAGFGSLSFYRERPAYRTSVEDSVYVGRSYHRQGVGDAILGALLETGKTRGFHAVFARIAGPQEASVALHRSHGFELVGIERQVARKFGKWHDVALMQRLL